MVGSQVILLAFVERNKSALALDSASENAFADRIAAACDRAAAIIKRREWSRFAEGVDWRRLMYAER